MRKIRKRVFAAVLAAALLFTMPGMASYAEAEDAQTKDISESVTVQAEDDAAEEKNEAMQESDAEDSDTDKPGTGEDDTGDTETDAQEPAEEETVPTQKEDVKECTCGTLCTQDSINGDCPVCGAEDADLSRCKGEKTENSSEENKEDAGQEDAGAQDGSANLCAHHKEHTKDCGYSRASEDGEGSLCTYECRICPIEALIAALPQTVTEDNAETVRSQLDEILALYTELSEDEQEQIDLSPCWNLQAALDEANAPAPIDEPTEGEVAQVEIAGSITYHNTIEEAWTAANGNTATITLLAEVTASDTLTVNDGTTIIFDGGDYTLTSGQQIAIQVNGTFKLVSGTIHSTCPKNGTGINVHGSLEMTGGTVSTSNSVTSGSIAVQTNSNSNITISGGKISGVYGINVNGGTVTIPKGEISGRSFALYILSGTVTIEGGTFTGSMYSGLRIVGGTVILCGGTFTCGDGGYTIQSNNDVSTLLDPTKPYVYFDANGQPVNLSELEDPTKLPEGTYTVGECTHLGALKDLGNGTHGGNCPYCETEFSAASHTLGVDNKCEGCGTPLVASVKIDSDITYYGGIDAAWAAAKGSTSTVTLLDHVTASGTLTVDNGGTVTFDGGNYTLTSGQQTVIEVNGTLKLVSGTVHSTFTASSDCYGIDVRGMLEMTGGAVTMDQEFFSRAVSTYGSGSRATISGGELFGVHGVSVRDGSTVTIKNGKISGELYALYVNGGTATVEGGTFTGSDSYSYGLTLVSGSVVLRGGTFTGRENAVKVNNSSDVSALLDTSNQPSTYYAYFLGGQPVNLNTLADSVRLPSGTYTVAECKHETSVCEYQHNEGTETHTLTCLACGYTGTPESCDYSNSEYQHDDTNHWQTCTVCEFEKTEAHPLKLAVQANGTVITARDACDCGYQKDLGTATFTVPTNLIYHDGQTIAWTASDGLSLSFKWDASGDGFTDKPISAAGLDAGEHTLNIEVSHDSQKASCSIPVTVKPATLTAAMVTVAPESVTYSGAAQEPAVTVKQGDTTLAEGADYNVTYSTTDFTNAGTVIITIKGEGNYAGTVEKTYTIKKAVLTTTDTGTANGTYGAKLSELSVTGLKAVIQGTATEVSGTWKLTGDTIPGVGDSGKYTATFIPDSGAGNYETLTTQVTLNIERAAAPAPQEGTLYVQNNREQSYQYDLTQLLPALDNGKSYGTVSYTLGAVNISGGYYTGGAGITGTTLTLPIQKVESDKAENIGEVNITITSGNYKDMSAVINVESVDKIPVTITGVSVAEREYNGKAIERIGTPKAVESNGSTAAISDDDYHYTWQTADGKDLSGAPKDAGSYQLTVSVDNGTYIGTSTISFVINKAAITITANSMTVNKGSAKPALTYTISGLAEKEALAVEPTLTCNADMNTVGRYPITVSGAAVPDSNNYHTEITYVPGALTVTASTSGGSSGGGNGGGDRGNNNGNGSGSENNGDGGQGNSSDNGGGNTTPGVPSVPAVTDTNQGTDTETAKPGTGNTARPGTGTEPESSTAKEERPDTGIPFIKGEDGKIGWNVIRAEEEKAEEGSVINVDMNGTAVVPGDIFDSIKGRDITITFDMGSGIVWSVDGKSITRDASRDKADDIDFTVRMGGSTVPVEIVNSCFANNVTGERYSIQLSLAHDGEFGFIAVLSVGIGEKNAGYLASLYYYNEDTGELEFICADEVAQDGTVSFAFTHASDYVVVVDREVEEESGTEETTQPEGTDSALPQDRTDGNGGAVVGSPKEGQTRSRNVTGLIIAGIIALAGIGAGIVIAVKKKRGKKNNG